MGENKKEWYCTGITCSSDRWITSTICGHPHTLFSSFFPLKKMLEKYFWGILPKPLFVKKRTDFLFNKTEKGYKYFWLSLKKVNIIFDDIYLKVTVKK